MALKVGILANDKREWHIRELMAQLAEKGAEAYVFPVTGIVSRVGKSPKVSVKGYGLEDYDAIIVRRVPGGSPEQVFYRMDVLHMLEELGVYVINPADAIERSVNKYYTSALLEEVGIKTPRTVVAEGFSDALRGFDELGGDVVVKPLFGSLGLGMTRVSDRDIAYRVFRSLEMTRSVFYLQEFIPHWNQDIRTFVIGDNVVASMLRTAEGWKTNLSSGGTAKPYTPNKDLIETSLKAARKIGLEYAGVDILQSEYDESLYVVELNSTPGWEGLQTVTEKNIAKMLVDYIASRIKG